MMKILGLEASSPQRSVALCACDGDGKDPAVSVLHEATAAPEDRTTLPALIEKVLRETGTDPGAITRLAVGLGPGSYTGIRLAIAAAQGWQLGRGTPVAGIPTPLILAHQVRARHGPGHLTVLINALREEVYEARYRLGETGVETVEALHLKPVRDLAPAPAEGQIVAGPEVRLWYQEGIALFPSAAMLCRLAAAAWHPVPAEELQPVYLRPTRFVKAPPPRSW